jgi:ABC-type transporter Mla MlaB component
MAINEQPEIHLLLPDGAIVEIITDSHGITARLVGEVDVASEYAFRLAMEGALTALIDLDGEPGARCQLVIDAAALAFCDVRGFAVLVDTVAAGRRAGAVVTVTGANDTLLRLWHLFEPRLPLDASRPNPRAAADAPRRGSVDERKALRGPGHSPRTNADGLGKWNGLEEKYWPLATE